MGGDGGRSGAVQPELVARLGAGGDKPFGIALVGEPHYFGCRRRYPVFLITRHIQHQHHLRPFAARRFGAVVDSAHIAFIEVFQA